MRISALIRPRTSTEPGGSFRGTEQGIGKLLSLQHQRRGPHEGSKVLCMGVTLHLDPSTLSRMENAGVKQSGGATRNLHRVLDALRNAGVELLPSAGAPRPRALALSARRERMRLRGRVQNWETGSELKVINFEITNLFVISLSATSLGLPIFRRALSTTGLYRLLRNAGKALLLGSLPILLPAGGPL